MMQSFLYFSHYKLEPFPIDSSHYTLYYLQADVDNVGSDFDLNSLIEGDVDDEDSAEDNDQDSRTPVVRTYYEPLKVRFQQLLLPQLLASDDVQ